ncbi:MAG: glycoside hydrolase family 20 zincin-like fold domain-containing protein [Myxococcota bacterium]|nr:glycoside hydrolase family 20 zincin-like fold domain-containing protein [Myxococcota bacterium]
MPDPVLLPRPREFEHTGEGQARFAEAGAVEHDSALPPQGYVLRAGPQGTSIRYADEVGLRYARATLAQLARSPAPVPALEIRDWPDFAVRGYMLDISRDRVPTRETLERIVDVLDVLRINHLELYTEHTFAFRDHETVWRDATPMTPEDLRWLDGLCGERGIELSANQNTFGHMGRWLRHPAYARRAEAPGGWRSPLGQTLEPGVLAPTPDNAEFALSLVREMMQNVTSRRVNIGCDETFELGRGQSRAEVEQRGRARVYLDHLKRLLAGLHEDGCEVLFWGDILREHPELVAELPSEQTVALAWWYEAPVADPQLPESVRELVAEFGISERAQLGFAGHVPAFVEAGLPFWVCPGTSTWNTLLGRWPNARANLLDAAEVGRAQRAGGYLITDWGDNGHMQPPSVSWLPLAYGASVSWCVEANRELDVAAALDLHVFEDAAGELGAALLSLGEAYLDTGKTAFNASPLFTATVTDGLLGAFGEPDSAALRRTLDRLEAAGEAVGRARPGCSDGAVVGRELAQAIRLARHGAYRLLRETGAKRPSDPELRRDLAAAIEEQAICWRLRSREGGLADSLARLQSTLASYGEA